MPAKHRHGSLQQGSRRLEERYGKIGISAVEAAAQYSGRRPTIRRSSKDTAPTSVSKRQKEPTKV
jgi:hypothetical protein